MPSIQELEEQITQLKEQLQAARKENPGEPVNNYTFQTAQGEKSLSDLFNGKDELFVIHNMGIGCNYCTLWADTLNSSVNRIRTRAEIALCSPDPVDAQAKIATDRKWDYQMVKDESGFTADLGYYTESGHWPGVSAFKKQADGSIVRLNHTVFGPGDDFCPIWPMWDLMGGENGWEPQN